MSFFIVYFLFSLLIIFPLFFFFFFFFNDTATTEIYTLSLHDALPISGSFRFAQPPREWDLGGVGGDDLIRSEEHTSELQSRFDLVCRLLLEKKKKKKQISREQKIINIYCKLNTNKYNSNSMTSDLEYE